MRTRISVKLLQRFRLRSGLQRPYEIASSEIAGQNARRADRTFQQLLAVDVIGTRAALDDISLLHAALNVPSPSRPRTCGAETSRGVASKRSLIHCALPSGLSS